VHYEYLILSKYLFGWTRNKAVLHARICTVKISFKKYKKLTI